MSQNTDDLNDAFEKATQNFNRKLKVFKEKFEESQEKIIADGVAKARLREVGTLTRSDRRFLKTLRIATW